jgi:tRNA pseudouridine55 synthase
MLQFRVHCSKGTYIRTLAEDIADQLGTCAHLNALRRLDVGPFREKDMITLDDLAALAERGEADSCLQPVDAGLADWPVVTLDAESANRFNHGNPVEVRNHAPVLVRVCGPENHLLGLGEVTEENLLKPRRVMHLPT